MGKYKNLIEDIKMYKQKHGVALSENNLEMVNHYDAILQALEEEVRSINTTNVTNAVVADFFKYPDWYKELLENIAGPVTYTVNETLSKNYKISNIIDELGEKAIIKHLPKCYTTLLNLNNAIIDLQEKILHTFIAKKTNGDTVVIMVTDEQPVNVKEYEKHFSKSLSDISYTVYSISEINKIISDTQNSMITIINNTNFIQEGDV